MGSVGTPERGARNVGKAERKIEMLTPLVNLSRNLCRLFFLYPRVPENEWILRSLNNFIL